MLSNSVSKKRLFKLNNLFISEISTFLLKNMRFVSQLILNISRKILIQ